MGGPSQAHAKQLLNHLLTSTPYTPAGALYLGLHEVGHADTVLTEADLTGTELTVAGYARAAITFAAAADGEDTRGAIAKSSNAQTYTASSGSQSADAWGIYDAVSGGNLLWWGELGDTAAVVDTGGYTIEAAEIACHIGPTGFTAYAAKKLLDHSLGVATYTQPARYLSLYSTAAAPPAESDLSGNELTGGGYTRMAAAFSVATNAGAGGQCATTSNITFPQATAGWSEADTFGIEDASSAGKTLAFGPLDAAITVASDQTLRIPAGEVNVFLEPQQ